MARRPCSRRWLGTGPPLGSGGVVSTLAPGKAVLHLEFTPRGENVWLSARDDNKVLIYDTTSFSRIGEIAADNPSGIFFTTRAARIGF